MILPQSLKHGWASAVSFSAKSVAPAPGAVTIPVHEAVRDETDRHGRILDLM